MIHTYKSKYRRWALCIFVAGWLAAAVVIVSYITTEWNGYHQQYYTEEVK